MGLASCVDDMSHAIQQGLSHFFGRLGGHIADMPVLTIVVSLVIGIVLSLGAPLAYER